MIKQNGKPRDDIKLPSLKRMSDTEYAAYFEAFGAIKSEIHALCLIGAKLREAEATARNIGSLDPQSQEAYVQAPGSIGDKSPWELCMPLMQLDCNEVLLCKRVCEHGNEYAVIDRSSVASAYTKANGPTDILRTGDNPRQVLHEFIRGERETLQLMVNDITANVRLFIAEKFPYQDLRRVVNEITRMCRSVARLGFSESIEAGTHTHHRQRSVRV
jgi:hypothetical protein